MQIQQIDCTFNASEVLFTETVAKQFVPKTGHDCLLVYMYQNCDLFVWPYESVVATAWFQLI